MGLVTEIHPCGSCRHFKDMGPHNKPDICQKKLMGVTSDMKVCYEEKDGTCWERAHLVPSAQYWYDAAIKNFKHKDFNAAMGCMQNAYNHVENALAAARTQADLLLKLRKSISTFKGHGMPGFKDRAEAYLVLIEVDKALNYKEE